MAETLRLLDGQRLSEVLGVLGRGPLHAVWLDDPVEARAVAEATRDVPAVMVGVARAPTESLGRPGLDVLLTAEARPAPDWVACPSGVEPGLAALREAVSASPTAAVALVQLLRITATSPVDDALVAESFVYSMLQAGAEFRQWLRGHARPHISAALGPPVLLRREGADLEVILNRPAVHNAVNAAMRDVLVEAFDLAARDPTIERVSLSAMGDSFSSGGDLKEFGTLDDPVTAHLARLARSPASGLARIAHQVTAHLHGHTVGAGIELAAFAHRVLAAPDTVVRLPELAMGLIPGAGGSVSITRRAGRQRMAYLALTGAALSAETALAWGLVDELAHPERPR